ncbi:ATP-dependent helicase HrpA [Quadrisphaera granulorum]|uniref:ATP-dependent helicase HrpA n=1 Tax=Quadrisphaera granulorum TaxID=317664 RepID=A0A316AA32_9ACTN|nr:ATP-dependent RNA helicase HrpA [Quadrisphaera granulorum]PWJ54635.1 ATP-dependent helicase HrpA [Quadrisphaera granulorum]SZE95997.1 ATP-dependent helicase HrpA [Quadrisphaera granulorum]
MTTTTTGPDPDVLRSGLAATLLRDERRLARRLDGAERAKGPRRAQQLAEVAHQVVAAQARLASRAVAADAVVGSLSYPDLPVSARRDDIADAIRDHQVVVVAGETGSGKTTQLPKICLELGRGVRGLIGHTQPRRIAARAVAERVAEELGTEVGAPGSPVGYAVRFHDEVGPDSLVKLMTDGILLAEVQRDPDLLAYDTIIIDEAHERSLTIDFLLGYLHRLLPRRPDLKVVITSATIDPQRFADHFGAVAGEVPVVEVSGRTFPVEIRYRPLSLDETPVDSEGSEDDDGESLEVDPDDARRGRGEDRDQTEGILDAVAELSALGDGDILVFLSGERDIRDTADALTAAIERREIPGLRPAGSGGGGATEVLPLFGRLSAADQHRVFSKPGAGTSRRIVLATNVAETSLTVPGIRYVVDTGTARISRYSARTKVQRLPIEPVSQASAAQRSGRCGRVADGVAIRLYSERDFESRPRFTQPEVQRTSLASVILQMASLGLGAVEDFPFLDAPDRRQVRDGLALLHELGAIDDPSPAGSPQLTDIGKRLAQVPADPRFARMLLQADREGVVPELLVLVASLSVQDVRERPLEKADAARESHRRFADEHSDFVSTLNLWAYLTEQAAERSSSSFRRMCKAEYLHHLRIREWQDVHAQLRRVLRGLGISTPSGAESAQVRTGEALEPVRAQVHTALLAGLLTQVGSKDLRAEEKNGRDGGREGRDGARETRRRGPAEYVGARGTRFAIAPGSVLAKRSPSWVVAAELVETSRLWARVVARVDPEQVETLAAHLVVRSHSEPRWSKQRGAAVATERVTLYGLPLVAGRTVPLARLDPVTARDLFIRHALVGGEWDARGAAVAFVEANAAVARDVEELQARTRRRDLRVDDEALVAFYDARLPADATSARAFEAWWRRERRTRPDLLTLTVVDLTTGDADVEDAPTSWSSGSFDLSLSYRFDPHAADDGVTVHVPLAVLAQVPETGLDWGVPAWRTELVTALLRALPKPIRVQLVPVPDTAREVAAALPEVPPPGVKLVDAVGEVLRTRRGVVVPPEAWDAARLVETAPHLLPTYALEDADGRVVATGKDLAALREKTAGAQRAAVVQAVTAGARASGQQLEHEALTSWPAGLVLAEQVETAAPDGRPVVGFPSLVVERWAQPAKGKKDGERRIAVRVLATEAEAHAAHSRGVARLARMVLANPAKSLLDGLGTPGRLALARSPHGTVEALLADCADAAVDHLVATRAPGGGLGVRDGEAFDALLRAVRPDLLATTQQVLGLVQRVLKSARDVEHALDRTPASLPLVASLADVRAQLGVLVHAGFVAEVSLERLPDVQRYLRALLRRLEVLSGGDGGNAAQAAQRDRDRTGVVQRLEADLERAVAALPSARRDAEEVRAVRWQLQELRVSLFAQTVGASGPVSEKRVAAAITALR